MKILFSYSNIQGSILSDELSLTYIYIYIKYLYFKNVYLHLNIYIFPPGASGFQKEHDYQVN